MYLIRLCDLTEEWQERRCGRFSSFQTDRLRHFWRGLCHGKEKGKRCMGVKKEGLPHATRTTFIASHIAEPLLNGALLTSHRSGSCAFVIFCHKFVFDVVQLRIWLAFVCSCCLHRRTRKASDWQHESFFLSITTVLCCVTSTTWVAGMLVQVTPSLFCCS